MKVSKDFGIVVKKSSIENKSININPALKKFNFDRLYDESDSMISIGPFFGNDCADDFRLTLEDLGLVYIDDFFVMEFYFPDWCEVEVFSHK